MSNPKTTIAGYLILVSSIITFVAHFLSGTVGQADFGLVLSALTGLGLVAASDGGH